MARSNGKRGGAKDLDKYEHVTMTINHLLHFFMEANGIGMNTLCKMGEEIYNLSCNKLFGDTLEDLQERDKEEMMNIKDAGQLKAKLFQEFIKDIENGSIPHNASFDEYLVSRGAEFTNIPRVNNNEMGQCLGRAPEEMEVHARPGWLDESFND
jgi:hypothetical protein